MIASETTRKNGRKLIVIVLDKAALARIQLGDPVELSVESADLMIAHEPHTEILANRYPRTEDLVKHLRRGVVRKHKT